MYLFQTGFNAPSKPIVNDCQWHERIGYLLPGQTDYWWTVHEYYDAGEIAASIAAIFNRHIFPLVTHNIIDEGFFDSILHESIPGITSLPRLIALTSFYCMKRDRENLDKYMAELKEEAKKQRSIGLYESQVEKVERYLAK